MISRPLIIPVSTLLASANLPKDVRVQSYGIASRNAPQTEQEETQGIPPVTESIVLHLESTEFKTEDEGKPLVQGLG